jgi:3-methyladenine DNA glycosylase AlkD
MDAFDLTLELIAAWRDDENRWVRRTIGHGVNLWAKRSKSAPELRDQAQTLLGFLDPLFEERDMDALKGIGWGLKTLGKHYPDLMADWLVEQVVERQRPYQALMLRKALTYLPEEQRIRVTGAMV